MLSTYWFKQAAEQGDLPAQWSLARAYETGRGVEQSDTEAAALYQKVAEQSHFAAQCILGRTYTYADGSTCASPINT